MGGLTRRELAGRAVAAGTAVALPPGFSRMLTAAGRATRDPVNDLRHRVRGPVLRPPDSRGLVYDERWEARRPKAVVQALDALDVRAVLRWAQETGTRLAVRSGGHSYAGTSTVAGGVVLDLRRMRRVSVQGSTAVVGPGAQLIDVYTALARRGATVPAGSCPSVGAGGLALGGGMGLAGRDRGLTCDNVVALHVVTADGTERVCDAHGERDLYWACRGGGGSFGVATRFRLRLHPAGPAAFFTCSWPASTAAEALAAWQAWAPHTDPRATSVFTLGAGGSVAAIGQYRGNAAALRALARPLARVPGARLLVGTSGYLALMRRWAGCLHLPADACHTVGTEPGGQLPRARFAAASVYVARALSASGRAALVALAQRAPPSSALLLDAHGGAINGVRPDATAFVHRRALFSVQILTYYSAGAEAAHLRWVRDAKRTLGPHSDGQAYQNYADPDLTTWRRAYYGSNYDRLAAIKARVDPGGLFRFHQAIGT